MNSIIKVLMKRDNMTEEEATELYNDTMAEIHDAIDCGDYDLVESLMYGDFGLELDYLMEVL